MTDTVISSATREVVIGFERPFVMIGERINPTGRKILAAEMSAGNFSRVESDARAQIAAGAQMLDVNAGIPLADEPAILAKTIQLVQSITDVPLSIDSSIVAALEAGLAVYQGKPLVNSVTGEDERLEQVLPLVAKYGASVVAITNDETGISEDPDVRFEGNNVYVDCAADLGRTVTTCAKHDLGGMEGLIGVPGSVGGALRMNAGAYGTQIGTFVREVQVYRAATGRIEILRGAEINFEYRHTSFAVDDIMLTVRLELPSKPYSEILQGIRICNEKRRASQPLNQKSAGCIFKNPPGGSAGRMIDELGLKGHSVGDARVSDRHANSRLGSGTVRRSEAGPPPSGATSISSAAPARRTWKGSCPFSTEARRLPLVSPTCGAPD
jgi:hypothetical protein